MSEASNPIRVSASINGAAAALGLITPMVELLTPAAARSMTLTRLREIEGMTELLGRHYNALEGFLQLLADVPEGATIGAGLSR